MKKVVVVTGLTGTLGRSFAEKFHHKYHIIGVGRRPSDIFNNICDFIPFDLSCDSHEKLVADILTRYKKIDILINNAVYAHWDHLSKITYSDFVKQLAVNVAAPLALSNACYHAFWSQRPTLENNHNCRGVVHIGSIASVRDYLGYGQGTYAASKAALQTLTRHMASDYREFGLKVNAIAPNSFPSMISTEVVCEEIDHIMGTDCTGKTIVLDANKKYVI